MSIKISFTYIKLRKGIKNIQFETMVYFNAFSSPSCMSEWLPSYKLNELTE